MNDIDLRGRVRWIEITVNDHEDKPLQQKDTRLYLADSAGEEWNGYLLNNGKVRVAIVDRARVRVLAKGYKFVALNDVPADRTIRLERAPAVRFRIKWPFALPEGLTTQLQLAPQEIAGTNRRTRLYYRGGSTVLQNVVHSDGFVDANGIAEVQPMVLGKQSARIALDPHGRGRYI